MRTEFIEYAFLSDQEREAIALPGPDAGVNEYKVFWSAVNAMKAARGEQPDSLALPNAGALRGDVPLSITEWNEV